MLQSAADGAPPLPSPVGSRQQMVHWWPTCMGKLGDASAMPWSNSNSEPSMSVLSISTLVSTSEVSVIA